MTHEPLSADYLRDVRDDCLSFGTQAVAATIPGLLNEIDYRGKRIKQLEKMLAAGSLIFGGNFCGEDID